VVTGKEEMRQWVVIASDVEDIADVKRTTSLVLGFFCSNDCGDKYMSP